MFDEDGIGRHMKLVSAQPFTTGVVYHAYTPHPHPPTGTDDEAREDQPQE